MQHLNMQTADAAEENIRRIARLFPGCVTETKDPDGTLRHKIDFDKLRAELGEEQILPEGSERYEFTWPGKRQAAAFAYRPIRAASGPAAKRASTSTTPITSTSRATTSTCSNCCEKPTSAE